MPLLQELRSWMNKICEPEVLYKMSVIATTLLGWVVVFYICFHCDFVFFFPHLSPQRVAGSSTGLCKVRGHGQAHGDVDTSRESCHCCAEIRGGVEGAPPRGWCATPSWLVVESPLQTVCSDFRYLIFTFLLKDY